jgi:hypothetical protein
VEEENEDVDEEEMVENYVSIVFKIKVTMTYAKSNLQKLECPLVAYEKNSAPSSCKKKPLKTGLWE